MDNLFNPITDYPKEVVGIVCKDCYQTLPETEFYRRVENHFINGRKYTYNVLNKRCKDCFKHRMKSN